MYLPVAICLRKEGTLLFFFFNKGLTENFVEKMSPFRSRLYVWCYFLQVEVLHDFEAANTDELNLKRGDIVLVIPSETTADQVKTCGSFFC